MLVVATPVVAVVAVVVTISPAVAIGAAHAAGKNLGYLHAVPPSLPGRLYVPEGVIASDYQKVSIRLRIV
jgi:hypothetical protein